MDGYLPLKFSHHPVCSKERCREKQIRCGVFPRSFPWYHCTMTMVQWRLEKTTNIAPRVRHAWTASDLFLYRLLTHTFRFQSISYTLRSFSPTDNELIDGKHFTDSIQHVFQSGLFLVVFCREECFDRKVFSLLHKAMRLWTQLILCCLHWTWNIVEEREGTGRRKTEQSFIRLYVPIVSFDTVEAMILVSVRLLFELRKIFLHYTSRYLSSPKNWPYLFLFQLYGEGNRESTWDVQLVPSALILFRLHLLPSTSLQGLGCWNWKRYQSSMQIFPLPSPHIWVGRLDSKTRSSFHLSLRSFYFFSYEKGSLQ